MVALLEELQNIIDEQEKTIVALQEIIKKLSFENVHLLQLIEAK